MPDVQLPAWVRPYLKPARYKVAHGGRGSGKSWAFARAILLRVAASKASIRVLCARELQVSIRDSVHRLLADQIAAMGLSGVFEVGESFIRCPENGSEFIFKGLRHNAGEIKSMERIGICWVEEAQGVSEESWKLLIPTVREPGSEIWLTFNPDQASDPTYQRFVINPPPGAIVRAVNWRDNPWFTAELDAERAWMAKTDPDAYAWVWEGECRAHSDSQVLRGKWEIAPFESGPDWSGPYLGADWGFSQDPTALVLLRVHQRRLYVEREAYAVGVEIDHLPELFAQAVPDIRRHLIHADSARPETISYLQRRGFRIVGARKGKGSVEEGVAQMRAFERIVIHPRCIHFAEEARLYSHKVDRLTGEVMTDMVDANNHCIDATRYALEDIGRVRILAPLSQQPRPAAPMEIAAL